MGLVSAVAQCALDFLIVEHCHACGARPGDERSCPHPLAAPVDVVTAGRFRLTSRLLCAACAAQVRPWGEPVVLPPAPPNRDETLVLHAAFVTDARLLAVIHLLKFGRRERIAPWLARAMKPAADAVLRSPGDGVIVAPVPMDASSRRRRGFNQAESIASTLAAGAGVVFRPHLLEKVRRTKPQSALGRAERMKNLDGAFRARADDARGRRVVLVDDLVTTGATVRACAHALRASEAAEVVVVCAGYRDDSRPVTGPLLQS
ncbi:MAG TPA: phosphoribosyltransferase family protein [Candidatus Krumholzibacteria bacterium]